MFLMLFASIPKVLKTESSPLAGKFLKRMLKSAYKTILIIRQVIIKRNYKSHKINVTDLEFYEA